VGARRWRPGLTLASFGEHFFSAALAALVVSLLEELLFRGALFGTFRRFGRVSYAIGLSSAIYAIVHFFERPPQPEAVSWSSGLITLGLMLRGFVDLTALIPGFFNLTLAGIILALAYHYSGSLYASIGIHAGWIFWLKSYGYFTDDVPGANEWWWGSTGMTDGWVAMAALGLALIFLRKMVISSSTETVRRGTG